VDVHDVDQEDFLHSGPDGIEQRDWWTRFEDVAAVSRSSRRVPQAHQSPRVARCSVRAPSSSRRRTRPVRATTVPVPGSTEVACGDCIRLYIRTLARQPDLGVGCWKLGEDGAFKRFPEPTRRAEAWARRRAGPRRDGWRPSVMFGLVASRGSDSKPDPVRQVTWLLVARVLPRQHQG